MQQLIETILYQRVNNATKRTLLQRAKEGYGARKFITT